MKSLLEETTTSRHLLNTHTERKGKPGPARESETKSHSVRLQSTANTDRSVAQVLKPPVSSSISSRCLRLTRKQPAQWINFNSLKQP